MGTLLCRLIFELYRCTLHARTESTIDTRVLLLAHLRNKKETNSSRNDYASSHMGATGAITYGADDVGYTGCHNMMAEVGHKEVLFLLPMCWG